MKSIATIFLCLALSRGAHGAFGRFQKGFVFDGPHRPEVGADVGDRLILTPYIQSGQIDLGRQLSQVGALPNSRAVPVSFSGYFTVNATYNSNLFFWFFPNPNPKAPILLWLQGGPGASSVFAIFNEIGPYVVQKDWQTAPVLLRDYTWTAEYHVLFIDQPVNTGFSFTDNPAGLATTEEDVARDLFEALQQFFTLFPEYQKNAFYLTGESYAGKYVPAIGYKIHSEKATAKMSLKGLIIGDGWSDPVTQSNYAQLMYQIGVLDENEASYVYDQESQGIELIKKGDYLGAQAIFDALMDGDLTGFPSYFVNVTGSTNYYNFLEVAEPEALSYANPYVVSDPVRKAIHVGNTTFGIGKDVETALQADIMKSVKPWLETLSDNYRVLLYSGQLDIIVGAPLTENMIGSMNWTGAEAWKTIPKQIWKADRKDATIAGYIRNVGGFFHIIIRNAGHMVPFDQPRAAYAMVRNFINDKFEYV